MRTLDLGDLRRMSVLDAGSGDRVGAIVDAVVHPTDGRLLGLLVRTTADEEAVLPIGSLRIGENAVMAATGAPLETRASSAALREGVLADGRLVGTNVVTEDGRLLGKVSDISIVPEHSVVAFRIAGSVLQKIFGGGFYIAGDVPIAISSDGARMIVPSDTEQRFAAGSVEELLNPKPRE